MLDGRSLIVIEICGFGGRCRWWCRGWERFRFGLGWWWSCSWWMSMGCYSMVGYSQHRSSIMVDASAWWIDEYWSAARSLVLVGELVMKFGEWRLWRALYQVISSKLLGSLKNIFPRRNFNCVYLVHTAWRQVQCCLWGVKIIWSLGYQIWDYSLWSRAFLLSEQVSKCYPSIILCASWSIDHQ